MSSIMIQLPPELKGLSEAMHAMVILAVQQQDLALAPGGQTMDYQQFERHVGQLAAGIERAVHQAVLQALDLDRPAVEIAGKRYSRVGRHQGKGITFFSRGPRRPIRIDADPDP